MAEVFYDVVNKIHIDEYSLNLSEIDVVTLILMQKIFEYVDGEIVVNYINSHEISLNQKALELNQSAAIRLGDQLIINGQFFLVDKISADKNNHSVLESKQYVLGELDNALDGEQDWNNSENWLPVNNHQRRQETILKKLEAEYYNKILHLPSDYEEERILIKKDENLSGDWKNGELFNTDSILGIVNDEYDINGIEELLGQDFNHQIFAGPDVKDILHVFNEQSDVNMSNYILPEQTIHDNYAIDIHEPFNTMLSHLDSSEDSQ